MLVARVDYEQRDRALARLYESVDSARAVWRGLTLIGHRRSIKAGHMFWAIPGRGFADGHLLRKYDIYFHVITEPPKAWLIEMQPILEELGK